MLKLNKTILILSSIIITVYSIFPASSFAQLNLPEFKIPETLDEAKEMVIKAFWIVEGRLWGILKKIWQEDVIPIWQKMWDWALSAWRGYFGPKFEALWLKIREILGREIEKRKPTIEEEFEKEKEEMKEELPKVTKSLWERFKELVGWVLRK